MAFTFYVERDDMESLGIDRPFRLDGRTDGFDSHPWRVEDVSDFFTTTADMETSDFFAERGGVVGASHVGVVDRQLTAEYIGADLQGAQRSAQTFFEPGQKVTVTAALRGEPRSAEGVVRIAKVDSTDGARVSLTVSITFEDPYFFSDTYSEHTKEWQNDGEVGYAFLDIDDRTEIPPLSEQTVTDVVGDGYKARIWVVPDSSFVDVDDKPWLCNMAQTSADKTLGGSFPSSDTILFNAEYIYTKGVTYDTTRRPYTLTFHDREGSSYKGFNRGVLSSAVQDIGRTNNPYGSLLSVTYAQRGKITDPGFVNSFVLHVALTRRRWYRGLL